MHARNSCCREGVKESGSERERERESASAPPSPLACVRSLSFWKERRRRNSYVLVIHPAPLLSSPHQTLIPSCLPSPPRRPVVTLTLAIDPMDSIPDPSSSSKPSGHPPSPWSYVVRGDPDGSPSPPPPPPPPTAAAVVAATPIPPPPEAAVDAASPLDSDKESSAASLVKKVAWKRPANGSIEVGPVMGAELWPALSESTKASSKPSPLASSLSSDFLKSSDGSASASPGPMIAASSPKVNPNNPNPNTNPNHAAPQSEKSMKRGTPANGRPTQPVIINPDKQSSPDPSPKDQPNINRNNWEHGTRSGDHGRGYGGTHRRGNNGSGGGGGGGPHHGGYNGRRDHGRGAGGGFDGYYRNANVRDVHVSQQPRSIRPPPPPPFVRAPLHVAPPPPFISPPPLARPFGHPMAFPEMHSPVYYVPAPPPPEAIAGLPFVAHPAAAPNFLFPQMDPQKAKLLTQINYYFSSENLCKDIFLRQNMDEQGWVPLSLIAIFNRVREITSNLEFIIETVQLSTVVELQGDKIRRRNDWMNWVLPHPNNIIPASGPSSPATPNVDTLSAHFQTVGLDVMNIRSSTRGPTRADSILNRSASGNNLNTRPEMGDIHGNEVSHAFTGHADSSEPNSARSLARSDTL